MAGFEPTNARVKVWCLTAWRHPNVEWRPAFGHTGYYNMTLSVLQSFFLEKSAAEIIFPRSGPGYSGKPVTAVTKIPSTSR